MPALDDILATIDLIYAAALDPARMNDALVSMGSLVGGSGSTFEVIDKTRGRHHEFLSAGTPHDEADAYVAHFARINPRIPHGLHQPVGQVDYDYRMMDEQRMRRDAFYADFLPRIGLRYYLATVLEQSDETFAVYVTQREAVQGHASEEQVGLMRRLAPHLCRAYDLRKRLDGRTAMADGADDVLAWSHDGAAVLDATGALLYANAALETIFRRGDGLRREAGRVACADPSAQSRFERALAACRDWRTDARDGVAMADFLVPRDREAPAYVVSCRPMGGKGAGAILVLVRDPDRESEASMRMLRHSFGLTAAEARLAHALQMGRPLAEHARRSNISLNTAYTHLSRLKLKLHCSRMEALHQRLNELIVSLRHDRDDV